jgi:hypothetical protein
VARPRASSSPPRRRASPRRRAAASRSRTATGPELSLSARSASIRRGGTSATLLCSHAGRGAATAAGLLGKVTLACLPAGSAQPQPAPCATLQPADRPPRRAVLCRDRWRNTGCHRRLGAPHLPLASQRSDHPLRCLCLRAAPSCSSASCRSSASSARLPRTSRLVRASPAAPSACQPTALTHSLVFRRPALPVAGRARAPGGLRGVPRRPVRGHQPVRNPRQARHDHAEGHPACSSYPRRARLRKARQKLHSVPQVHV